MAGAATVAALMLAAADVCLVGTYRNLDPAVAPFREGCPGFSLVEPGFFQSAPGVKSACPAGRHSAFAGAVVCDSCAAGFFCRPALDSATLLLTGSASATQHTCGGAHVFCPAGSADPQLVPVGFFSVATDGRDDDPATAATRVAVERCPRGHFCVDGVRAPCPAGRFGAAEGLQDPGCSGPCPAGYFCPAGSIDAFAFPCGTGPDVFCPEGSRSPQGTRQAQGVPGADDPQLAHFSRGAARLEDGSPALAPSLPTSRVSGAGQANSATPPASDRGPLVADESSRTRSVRVEEAVCPLGHYCVGGARHPCPAGRFGSSHGLASPLCTGECSPGHYCPAGSAVADQLRCGGTDRFCPAGSGRPTPVSPGFFTTGATDDTRSQQHPCPPGEYCELGLRFLCPAGRFGNRTAESSRDCSGPCESGFWCERGSTSARQHPCGAPNVYCPVGSHSPVALAPGYYTVRVEVVDSSARGLAAVAATVLGSRADTLADGLRTGHVRMNDEVAVSGTTRTHALLCDRGFFCPGDGSMQRCPPGRFGDLDGEARPSCRGPCAPGYLCPAGSSIATQQPCGAPDRFCPEGSFAAVPVREGFFTLGDTPSTRSSEAICPPGSFCRGGLPTPCPAGTFGSTEGLATPDCSGPCREGYYCPEGSTQEDAVPCGGTQLFCPRGSGVPLPVLPGFYTVGGRTRANGGRRDPEQTTECDRTFLDTQGQPIDPMAAAAAVLRGPVHVPFDVARTCRSGVIGDDDTRSAQVACEPGHFCRNGRRFECPPGRFGSRERETDDQCEGPCKAGFYCGWASVAATQAECGGPDRYCPPASGIPTPVRPGFFTVLDQPAARRVSEQSCMPGYYCIAGEKFICPAGTFGSSFAIQTQACDGPCAPGFFCPPGSTRARERPCGGSHLYCPVGSALPTPVPAGTYSTGGIEGFDPVLGANSTRTGIESCPVGHYCAGGVLRQCPAGRWANETEAATPDCNGPCEEGYFCPPGSTSPREHECGDYFLDDIEPDIYTLSGVAVGASRGLAADEDATRSPRSVTDGVPAMDNQTMLAWESGVRVRRPHARANLTSTGNIHSIQLDAGPSSVFCPAAAGFPTPVRNGYYSVGGGALFGTANRTRTAQTRCEPGFFCVGGRKIPCPPGTFGRDPGLFSQYCSAPCPAGHYCPIGSAAPLPCPDNTYATGGLYRCIACPNTPLPPSVINEHPLQHESRPGRVDARPRSPPTRCKDSRACCGV